MQKQQAIRYHKYVDEKCFVFKPAPEKVLNLIGRLTTAYSGISSVCGASSCFSFFL
jgi:hypothetical protein